MESARLKNIIWHPFIQHIPRFVLAFLIILLSAKFGQYIFFEYKTSPAILWPPTGIGVAIMWLYGYRFSVPIFLGLLVASLTGPTAHYFPGVITTPLSQVVGQLIGVFLLKHFKFEGGFVNIRTVLVFFVSIILLALFSPAVSTTISYFTGSLSSSYVQSFGRLWAGYVFSCLILTPFIIAWAIPEPNNHKNSFIESVFIGALLTIATYLLFWLRIPPQYELGIFGLFFLAVVWICLRFPSRIVTLSVVYVTIFGILGLFLSPNPERTLSQQVFATELLFFIVVPIMYAYSALVKEREQNLQKLELAFAKIEQENANKSNFIAVLAHELRNPLAPIKTTLEIMKLQKVQPEIDQLVTSAHNQVHVMQRLLDDLLDVTRVTLGKFHLKPETVHLIPLLHTVVNATKPVVYEHGHTLVLEANESDEILIYVDSVRFEQVLVNVINNAAKFTESGGKIKVSYIIDGSCLELRIQDNGKGIAEDNLDSVFKSFWQIKDAQYHTTSGIGVGLALARQIVELHQGSIRAESKGIGHGSTFIISIPCITAPSETIENKKEELTVTQPYKLLVVDDNKPAADALSQLLTLKGHMTCTAYSGKEALEARGVYQPDIVLLDIGLPDMSGHEVARKMRAEGFVGGLVAITGYGQEDDKQKAVEAGFDFHFTKPVSFNNLEAYLHMRKEKEKSDSF